jgi:hypothetical protein
MNFLDVVHTTGAVRTFAPESVPSETLYRYWMRLGSLQAVGTGSPGT